MLEHFCECYFDLSGPILCPVLGSITPLFIPNSSIRPIRLIGLCVSLITFLYPPVPRIQFDPSTAKSQFVESLRWLPYENIHFYLGIDDISLFFAASLSHLIAYWSYQQPILCSASEEPRPLMPLNERPFGHAVERWILCAHQILPETRAFLACFWSFLSSLICGVLLALLICYLSPLRLVQ
jgi:NADH:ubiquinone oxidoreductase subunit 4 (subunit M)